MDFRPATGSVYRRPPADVLAAVEIVLRDLGITRLYRCVDPRIGVGVLSVATGVTAWCNGRTVEWWHSGEDARWSAADPDGAAQQLAKLVRTAIMGKHDGPKPPNPDPPPEPPNPDKGPPPGGGKREK